MGALARRTLKGWVVMLFAATLSSGWLADRMWPLTFAAAAAWFLVYAGMFLVERVTARPRAGDE